MLALIGFEVIFEVACGWVEVKRVASEGVRGMIIGLQLTVCLGLHVYGSR